MSVKEPRRPETASKIRVTATTYPVLAVIDTIGTYDLQAGLASFITTQPTNAHVCPDYNTTIRVVAANTDTFQWQFYNGSSWVDFCNSRIHSGTPTLVLSITFASAIEHRIQHRNVIFNTLFMRY